MAKWLNTEWRYAVTTAAAGMPIQPSPVDNFLFLTQINAHSDEKITCVRTRYQLQVSVTIDVQVAGTAVLPSAWWADFNPTYGIYYRPLSSGAYPNPWGAGAGADTSVASGAFDLQVFDSGPDPLNGSATQTAVWTADGNTEGMRSFPGAPYVETLAMLGWNFSSYLATADSPLVNSNLSVTGMVKTLFGSAGVLS